MNKISNLSMITLLFIFISISNVYGAGPWTFKLQFGDLKSYIDVIIDGAYYQLECTENLAGTGKTIWRSTEDGFNFISGTSTLPEFDIPAQDSVSTPWYIVDAGYYYSCDLYVYQSQATGDDIKWGWAPLKLNELESINKDTKQIVTIVNPADEFDFWFHVELWSEVKPYPGPWKIKLSTGLLTNLMDRDFTGLYFKLECHTKQDSFAEGDSIKYISYEDGYAWIEEFGTNKKVTCEKFDVEAKGGVDAFTGWNINPDEYFYGCDLYLATVNSLTMETKWAVYILPLRIANYFSSGRYMKLYQVEDAENERFGLEYQLLAEIQQ